MKVQICYKSGGQGNADGIVIPSKADGGLLFDLSNADHSVFIKDKLQKYIDAGILVQVAYTEEEASPEVAEKQKSEPAKKESVSDSKVVEGEVSDEVVETNEAVQENKPAEGDGNGDAKQTDAYLEAIINSTLKVTLARIKEDVGKGNLSKTDINKLFAFESSRPNGSRKRVSKYILELQNVT